MIKVILFILGILLFTLLPTLEYALYIALLLLSGSVGIKYLTSSFAPFMWQYAILFFLGYVFTLGYYHTFYTSIPKTYFNTLVDITGVIENVTYTEHRATLLFNAHSPFKAKLRLNIYGDLDTITLTPGDIWKFKVKVKTPHGFFNDGGFDYEQYLFSNKITGVGYINLDHTHTFISKSSTHKINQIRHSIGLEIEKYTKQLAHAGIIHAITIGDKSLISKDTKSTLQQTNTTHLSVISGLHIGMIAGFGFLLSYLLFNYAFFTTRIPFSIIAGVVSLLFAGGYTLLAGLSLPTTRAFIMLCVFLLGILSRTHYTRWQLFAVAMVAVLLINPFAVLSASLYLSFGTVLVIVYYGEQLIAKNSWHAKLYYLFLMQIIISLFSGVMSIYFFGFFSSGSIVANMIAIPLFSFIVVPFSLFATFSIYIGCIPCAELLYMLVNESLDILVLFLSWLTNIEALYTSYVLSSLWHVLLLGFAVFLITTQPRLKLLPLGVLLLLITTIRTESYKEFSVLDVGQGSASVLIHNNQAAIFDTGDKFRSGFSLANAVIIPFLKNRNTPDIHTLVISHEDRDHSGGKSNIVTTLHPQHIIEPHTCIEGTTTIGEYALKVFTTDNVFTGNNGSCVVQIHTPHLKILIPGDIEKAAEHYLIKKYQEELRSDVLIVPHHGSKSSSTIAFINTVKPRLAIISSGYENRYNHPHESIIKRYAELDIVLLNTACTGQISIDLERLDISLKRNDEARFYHHQCDKTLAKHSTFKDILK